MDEIVKSHPQQLAWNGKPVRSTDEQMLVCLAPMFALFPQTKADKNTVAAYLMMLRDIEPEALAAAVLRAMGVCKFLPTVAEIREQLDTRTPGPRNDVALEDLKPVPTRMFRLDSDEDRQQRLARLRMTKNWDKHYQ